MTNPGNAVGTNAAYAGRTSVNAFNDSLAAYSRGIISGWECSPSSGLTIVLGGDGNTRDVAVAEDNSGNKTSIDNISGAPISLTLPAAPGANSRIDAIVAYVDNPPQGSATIVDNYEACGLIAVSGATSASPVAPDDSAIRSAITADGASGTTAYYVVLAYVTMPSGTTDVTSTQIQAGGNAGIGIKNVDFESLSTHIYYTTVGSSISFTAEADMYVEVEALTGYVWGYAGGTVSLDVATSTGLTPIFNRAGGLTGGDGAGRQLSLHALYSTTKGTACTVQVNRGGATGGAQSGAGIVIIKCYKLAQYGN